MRHGVVVLLFLCLVYRLDAQKSGTDSGVDSLLGVKRIYVSELTGGAQAAALRDLIIAGLDAAKLFLITDNLERADAVLKGAADDHTFTDTFDSNEELGDHENLGVTGSGAGVNRSGGGYLGASVNESDSHHIRERKHEAFAAVRLCNKDGDVLWSTTQESLGAKFRGAGADVAAKVAHQLSLDLDRERRIFANGVSASSESGKHDTKPTVIKIEGSKP